MCYSSTVEKGCTWLIRTRDKASVEVISWVELIEILPMTAEVSGSFVVVVSRRMKKKDDSGRTIGDG